MGRQATDRKVAHLDTQDTAAIYIATGYARQAMIALGDIGHMHPGRAAHDFQKLADAEALLQAALEIVEHQKARLAVKL